MSVDYHPQDPNLLLVGSTDGLISICSISQQPNSIHYITGYEEAGEEGNHSRNVNGLILVKAF